MTLVVSQKIYFVFESKAQKDDKTPKLDIVVVFTTPSPAPITAAPITEAPITCVPKNIGCGQEDGCIVCRYLTSTCEIKTKTNCNSCGMAYHK